MQSDYAGRRRLTVDPARQAAAYQAWWEHMPVRLPPPDGPALAIHRSIRLGDTAEVFLLDTRQHRSAEACGGGVVDDDCGELAAAGRTMLGAEPGGVARRRVGGLGGPVVGGGPVGRDLAGGRPRQRQRRRLGRLRRRSHAASCGALASTRNAVVLTGDVHVQVVADVTDRRRNRRGHRAGHGIGHLAAGDAYREGVTLLPTLVEDVQHAADVRGWLRCEVDADAFRATYREVADVDDAASPVVDGPTFVVHDGIPGARLG